MNYFVVFNKNVNICLRCEQKTLNFNNEVIKSIGLRKTEYGVLEQLPLSSRQQEEEREGGETGGEGESEEEIQSVQEHREERERRKALRESKLCRMGLRRQQIKLLLLTITSQRCASSFLTKSKRCLPVLL